MCNLFEWDDEIETGHEEMENEDEELKNDSTKLRELKSFETLKEMCEPAIKKNVELEIKLKTVGLCGKMKTICLILSLMVNFYLAVKCNRM